MRGTEHPVSRSTCTGAVRFGPYSSIIVGVGLPPVRALGVDFVALSHFEGRGKPVPGPVSSAFLLSGFIVSVTLRIFRSTGLPIVFGDRNRLLYLGGAV